MFDRERRGRNLLFLIMILQIHSGTIEQYNMLKKVFTNTKNNI